MVEIDGGLVIPFKVRTNGVEAEGVYVDVTPPDTTAYLFEVTVTVAEEERGEEAAVTLVAALLVMLIWSGKVILMKEPAGIVS